MFQNNMNYNTYSMSDNASINDSFNQTNNINIYIERPNIVSRVGHGKYEYDMFCIGEYCKVKDKKTGEIKFIRVTCVNVHSKYIFISDHLQVDIPVQLYHKKMFDHSLIKVMAEAYPYKRKDDTKSHSLKVTELLDISNKLIGVNDNYFKLDLITVDKNNKESVDRYDFVKTVVEKVWSENYLREVVQDQLSTIDESLSKSNNFCSGFITNMIITYYYLNSKLDDLYKKKLIINELPYEALIDLLKINSYLIYKINMKEIFAWEHLLIELNKICNYIQRIIYDPRKITKRNKKEGNDIFNSVKTFISKLEEQNTDKAFSKIRNRNKDFGYIYPEDNDKFEEDLWLYIISYCVSKRCVDMSLYTEDWKEWIELSR